MLPLLLRRSRRVKCPEMMKVEIIRRYGEAAYEKMRQQSRRWKVQHREEHNASSRKWDAANPRKVLARHHETGRKGGKYYEKNLEYKRTGLQGERNRIRRKHAKQYHPFKQIIAPESQIHHEWIPDTANFRGVALVEKDQHIHGYVDVIKIIEGEITLLTEKEIGEQGGRKNGTN